MNKKNLEGGKSAIGGGDVGISEVEVVDCPSERERVRAELHCVFYVQYLGRLGDRNVIPRKVLHRLAESREVLVDGGGVEIYEWGGRERQLDLFKSRRWDDSERSDEHPVFVNDGRRDVCGWRQESGLQLEQFGWGEAGFQGVEDFCLALGLDRHLLFLARG